MLVIKLPKEEDRKWDRKEHLNNGWTFVTSDETYEHKESKSQWTSAVLKWRRRLPTHIKFLKVCATEKIFKALGEKKITSCTVEQR